MNNRERIKLEVSSIQMQSPTQLDCGAIKRRAVAESDKSVITMPIGN